MNNNKLSEALKDFDFTIISQNTDETVVKIKEKKILLKELKNGTIFKVGKYEFIKLGGEKDTTAALCKDFIKTTKFGNSNDYKESSVRKLINGSFKEEIEKEVGEANLITHSVNLISLDGQKEYKTVKDKVSLITIDNYRRYRSVIPNYNDWWWTATPYSTESNGYSSCVCCVNDGGSVGWGDCGFRGGVRPFCIFLSSIFVSL